MNTCQDTNINQVPLLKAVRASIVDVHGNITELQEKHSFWAARGLRKMQREVLKVGKTKILLPINRNTMTATMPLDFGTDIFVGAIVNGKKVQMKASGKFADVCNIQEVPLEDACTSCGQDKTICEDLSITESVVLVVINGSAYENVTVKKMYPNGDYYLEKSFWYQDIETGAAVQAPLQREFITNFGLNPCGCIGKTPENIQKLQTHCYDCYCCNYAECSRDISSYEYAIMEDTGLIQVEYNYPYDFIYLEYLGFMPKRNGQYMVPEVAFETIVEWTKWMAIKDKNGVERWRIKDAEKYYTGARARMVQQLTRTSISRIISIFRSTPKFNLDYDNSWYSCFDKNAINSLVSGVSGGASSPGAGGGDSNTTIINNYPTTIINNPSYKLAVKTGNGPGHPVEGQTSYQNNLFIQATDIEFIFLAKQTLSKIDGDFTHDAATGTIQLTGLTFFNGDSLIVPYNKTS